MQIFRVNLYHIKKKIERGSAQINEIEGRSKIIKKGRSPVHK